MRKPKVYVDKSNIAGDGLFASQDIKKGEKIGTAHVNGQPTPVVGKKHNHSEKPNMISKKKGNTRDVHAKRNIRKGEELTTDYRMQPELEQPEDFQTYQRMTPQKDGYRTYSPFKNLPYIDVNSNTIDTDNIVHDLHLIGNNNVIKTVKKNTGIHTVPGASQVREIPVSKKGGWLDAYDKGGSFYSDRQNIYRPIYQEGGNYIFRIPEKTTTSTTPEYPINPMSLTQDSKNQTLKEGRKEAEDWLSNWYSQRADLPQFTDLANRRKRAIDKRYFGFDTMPKDEPGTAMYWKGKIFTRPNDPYSSSSATLLHEFTHGLDDKTPQDYQESLTRKHFIPEKEWLKTESGKKFGKNKNFNYKYFTDPSEGRARLNTFRRRYNIDPSKTYTADEMKSIIENYRSYNKEGMPSRSKDSDTDIDTLFDIIGDDPARLAELNNTIVGNTPTQQPPTAKEGGWLEAYQNGGNCDGEDCSPEGWEKEIREVEHRIGDPKKWTKENQEELQNKLNEYKHWRENTPEGKAVIDYHNEPNEYVVFPPAHLNKEKYNMKRALELGYEPDEMGHWPSVDYESGEYLKSKKHPTAWKEYLYGYTFNPEQALNYNVVVNPEGYFGEDQLQYVPKQKKGGSTPSNSKLYGKVLREAKKKFKVWPNPFATAWVNAEYKRRGGDYNFDMKWEYGRGGGTPPDPETARDMLQAGTAHGHPLTARQKAYLAQIAGTDEEGNYIDDEGNLTDEYGNIIQQNEEESLDADEQAAEKADTYERGGAVPENRYKVPTQVHSRGYEPFNQRK